MGAGDCEALALKADGVAAPNENPVLGGLLAGLLGSPDPKANACDALLMDPDGLGVFPAPNIGAAVDPAFDGVNVKPVLGGLLVAVLVIPPNPAGAAGFVPDWLPNANAEDGAGVDVPNIEAG